MKKQGYRTSEFWLSLAAVVVGALMASGAFPTDHFAMKICGIAATVLAALGYGAARTFGKVAEAKEVAKLAAAPLPSDGTPTSPPSP